MLIDLLIAISIAVMEVAAIVFSVDLAYDADATDRLNRNVQTIANTANQSTLLKSLATDNPVEYRNRSIFKGGAEPEYFRRMSESLWLDGADGYVVYRKYVEWKPVDFFLSQRGNVGCFGIYKQAYGDEAERDRLVSCSESIGFEIRTKAAWIYEIDHRLYGKNALIVAIFENVDEKNVY